MKKDTKVVRMQIMEECTLTAEEWQERKQRTREMW